jgi:hypothetical protein
MPGDLTKADASRIDWKLESGRAQRKIGELIFLCVVFSLMSFFAGYVAGKKGLLDHATPEFAKKLGEHAHPK